MARWSSIASALPASRLRPGVLPGAVAGALLCASPPASAQTCQGQFTDISFGTINLTNSLAVDGTGSLQVQCSGTSNATVRVCPNLNSGSAGDAGSPAARLMTNGASTIFYSVYTDPARSVIWGSYLWGYSGSAPSPQFDIPLGPTGQATVSYPVYARIQAGQPTAAAGTYQTRFNGQQDLISSGYTSAGSCAIISGTGGRRANFTLNAVVAATCSLTTTPVAFGSKSSLSTITDASGQLRVTCTTGASYTVGLDGGASGATSPTSRQMTSASASITYGLYGDAARTQPWFNTTAFFRAGGTGTGIAQTLTVYGRIPVQATPPAGTYSDNVVVTVTY